VTSDSNPVDGFRGAVGELVGELGSLVPRLLERSRGQWAVLSKVVEQLPCLSSLVGGSADNPTTPDLRLVTGGADDVVLEDAFEVAAESVEVAVVEAPKPPAVKAKAPAAKRPAAKRPAAKKTVAKKTVATKAPAAKAPAKKASVGKAPTKKAPAKSAAAKKAPASKVPARKVPAKRPAAKRAPASSTPAPAVAASLALADYDELAASQVIPRLDSMSSQELESIRLHESSHRQRRTILSRIAQLQTG
jgi:hypothetical protein